MKVSVRLVGSCDLWHEHRRLARDHPSVKRKCLWLPFCASYSVPSIFLSLFPVLSLLILTTALWGNTIFHFLDDEIVVTEMLNNLPKVVEPVNDKTDSNSVPRQGPHFYSLCFVVSQHKMLGTFKPKRASICCLRCLLGCEMCQDWTACLRDHIYWASPDPSP